MKPETFVIKKIARAYITATNPGSSFEHKILRNEVCEGWKIGQTVTIIYDVIRKKSGWGHQTTLEPLGEVATSK